MDREGEILSSKLLTSVKKTFWAHRWLSQLSNQLMISAQVMISALWEQALHPQAPCSAGSLLKILWLPLLLPLPLLSLSLSLIHK